MKYRVMLIIHWLTNQSVVTMTRSQRWGDQGMFRFPSGPRPVQLAHDSLCMTGSDQSPASRGPVGPMVMLCFYWAPHYVLKS